MQYIVLNALKKCNYSNVFFSLFKPENRLKNQEFTKFYLFYKMPPVEPQFQKSVGGTKQKKDRKILNPQAKELILNVVNFMKKEACGEFIIPARKVQCRAATATGFSERTVRRIVKESKSLHPCDNSKGEAISFPPKKIPNRPKPKTGLDELTRSAVRKIIHKIYVVEKTVPTIKKIHQKLIHEINFKGGSRSAHKIIKELGFFWKKTKCKSFVLIEKHEIRLKRIEYLRDILKFRKERRPIVYIGDMSILTSLSNIEKAKFCGERLVLMHAGGEQGFVPNALTILQTSMQTGNYHQELSELYYLWVKNTLIPTFRPGTVVVIDTLACQNIQIEKIPTSDSSVEQMKQWLLSKNINFNNDMLRPELHQIIKRHASKFRKQKGIIDEILTEKGHSVLKLPPHHPDLNPVDLMWADVKQYVADKNITFNVSDIKTLCKQKLSQLGPEAWLMRCNSVKNNELQYLESEKIIDHEIEKIMTKPTLSSSSSLKTRQQEGSANCSNENHDNINFVKPFMGGFLNLEEYKMFSS